ncbi:hypothetical protein KUTeg_010487 [Tegillarca granosa]|uniref:G-protein coupled receptors family 1 profile domain-containing protein n=1 Tax=Tegillarca granosa TaxID=220873 RepID=A0ABQ9F6V4_TEGGR|nr:hypothetical protein KUTeg_010487 [Tegillarca granosa]
MLATVVGVFLLVELPTGICIVINTIENTWRLNIIDRKTFTILNVWINFFVFLTCPINFFIYCGMSRQFRETFKQFK